MSPLVGGRKPGGALGQKELPDSPKHLTDGVGPSGVARRQPQMAEIWVRFSKGPRAADPGGSWAGGGRKGPGRSRPAEPGREQGHPSQEPGCQPRQRHRASWLSRSFPHRWNVSPGAGAVTHAPEEPRPPGLSVSARSEARSPVLSVLDWEWAWGGGEERPFWRKPPLAPLFGLWVAILLKPDPRTGR